MLEKDWKELVNLVKLEMPIEDLQKVELRDLRKWEVRLTVKLV